MNINEIIKTLRKSLKPSKIKEKPRNLFGSRASLFGGASATVDEPIQVLIVRPAVILLKIQLTVFRG